MGSILSILSDRVLSETSISSGGLIVPSPSLAGTEVVHSTGFKLLEMSAALSVGSRRTESTLIWLSQLCATISLFYGTSFCLP